MRLGRRFFARHVLDVARRVLGRVLVHDEPGGRVAGRIVEVEAYRGRHDPASHAFRGPTPRAAIMFGPPGFAYVYLSYGVHHCLNLVCEREGTAAAVLIRAIEPVEGIARMRARRPGAADHAVGRGPGCVARALGLTRDANGIDLTRGALWVAAGRPVRGGRTIVAGPRIGIRTAVERPWRFSFEGHPCVSGRPAERRSGVVPRARSRVRR